MFTEGDGKMKEIITLKELRGELKKKKELEEELFDNCNDIKLKELHLANINKLNIKIGQLNIRIKKIESTYVEDEDSIKAPFEYIASEEEFLSSNNKDEE